MPSRPAYASRALRPEASSPARPPFRAELRQQRGIPVTNTDPATPKTDTPADSASVPTPPVDPREARTVVLSSAVGTTIEFYDFALYGLASALVFAPQFFPADNQLAGQLGALASFAIGFFFRPIGGIVAGHFGDRIGRKRVLVWSFMVMGLSTMLIAFLPTYATIGLAAPALLVFLRAVQGVAAGAEWGGAALMAVEHAPPGKRGLYGSAPAFGTTAGPLLASTMFIVVSTLDPAGFAGGGWRIAFGISFVLLVFGFYLRKRVTESPLFESALAHEPPRVPLIPVLREHPLGVLRAMSWVLVSGATGYVVNTYGLTYAIETTGASRATVLMLLNLAYLASLVALFTVGRLVDRRRRVVLITVALLQIPAAVLLFPLLALGDVAAVGVAFCLVWLAVGAIEATRGAVLADLFPVEVRYSGVSLSYNLAYVLAGLAPLATASIVAATGSITWMVVILAIAALIALPVALTGPRR
ncbi:MFS transporter [Actinomycetospora termitidis]|uniref:MFS transporter n=1 Tax=Actinomycetospora termitidis TaxID=3053470 RepID=A0ABT7M712_9PSEU|nr:MFS transporter [Actinomycetospora sp. Odt1-22]MDL5156236.1 MFS transporter [Actinomycetospora sp. Odt1-22]